MFPEQGNTYINRNLWRFTVERENLSRAINGGKKDETLEISHTMRQLLMNVRSSIREHMIKDTQK